MTGGETISSPRSFGACLEVAVVVASFSVSAGQTLLNVKGFESPSTTILEGFACTIPAM
jgi:hypothetical protein